MKKMIALADVAQSVRDPDLRNKKCRLIKAEMTKLKKSISKALKNSTVGSTPVDPSTSAERPATKMAVEVSADRSSRSSSEDRPLKPKEKTDDRKVRIFVKCVFNNWVELVNTLFCIHSISQPNSCIELFIKLK